nr:ribonuclease H-like domain-containing protein [Tanacetum cinerariifolium]
NRFLVTKPHNKTPYELLIGRSPNLDFMRPFGCPVTILNTLDHLRKFEGKADEGILVRYSINSLEWLFDIDSLTQSMTYELVTVGNQTNDAAYETPSKGNEGVSKGSGIGNQEMFDSSFQDVNTAEPSINTANTNINTGSLNINTISSNDLSMPSLEETGIFDDVYDDREVGAEADIKNLELSSVVSPIPTTRVHKDHLKEQIIRDLNLATQT